MTNFLAEAGRFHDHEQTKNENQTEKGRFEPFNLTDFQRPGCHGEKVDGKRLRELVGHTWAEVFGGVGFGVAFYFLV